jgi:hypothetical protein
MVQKKTNKRKAAKETYMFPSLHQDVVIAVSGQIVSPRFRPDDNDSAANSTYSTNVMGTVRGCAKVADA